MARPLTAQPLRTLGLTAERPPVPPVPASLSARSRDQWERFWSSPLVRVLVPALDVDAIETLFVLRDERQRAIQAGKKQRIVIGSTGQQVLNPLLKYALELQREIRAIEATLGLNPQSRLKLSVLLGDASRSLEDVNADLEADTDVADLLSRTALEG